MSSIYDSPPNQVSIEMKDESGEAQRFVVNKTLDEVIAVIEEAFGAPPVAAPAPKKARKPRRTKQQMQAAEAPHEPEAASQEAPPPHKTVREKAWT